MVSPVLADANRPANERELSCSCNEFRGGEIKKVRARRGREFYVLSTTKRTLGPKAEVWRADRSSSRQVIRHKKTSKSKETLQNLAPTAHHTRSEIHNKSLPTMSNPNQQATGAAFVCQSTVPTHTFGVFGGGLMPEDHKTLPLSPSAGFLKRTIRYLMHPPAQPNDPPVHFVIVNLDWARAIVGNRHFRAMGDSVPDGTESLRFFDLGLKGKRAKSSRPGLKERGLEFGLPYVYFMALCGERKVDCEGGELILTKEEWEDGKSKREEKEIEWMTIL
jgi:hypothetical protein